MHLRETLRNITSLPKTIYFNFKVLPFKEAMLLPFYVDRDMRIGKLYKNVVKLNFSPERFAIKFGKRAFDGIPECTKGFISMAPDSEIVFSGKAEFSYGVSFRAIKSGRIHIGKNFYCNKNCMIVSRDSIVIGDDVLIGWNVCIRDNDGETHKIYVNGIENSNKKPISIGNHVWICAYAHVLKGVNIPNDTVIAYNSCVTKSFDEEHTIMAGSPASVIKRDIEWEQ